MLLLRTATGKEYPIAWIGVSELDGSLRFEVTGEQNMFELVTVFIRPEETHTLTRIFDEDEKEFSGFTVFKGVDKKFGDGGIVIALVKGE